MPGNPASRDSESVEPKTEAETEQPDHQEDFHAGQTKPPTKTESDEGTKCTKAEKKNEVGVESTKSNTGITIITIYNPMLFHWKFKLPYGLVCPSVGLL